jgi:protein gp37
MGADTRIEWATHSFNPWSGCTKVSPACDHCYAEATAKRAPATFGGWGPHAERKRTSESYWRQPLLWNKRAAKDGVRPRVFCASMADVFDNAVPEDWRADLWTLIGRTPHLDWLLLTKRPQNIAKMLPVTNSNAPGYRPWNMRWPWPNVWLGTTVENQAEADRRIPHLLAAPAAKRFLSCEPLLGPVDLTVDGLSCGPCPRCSEGQHWEPDTNANGCPYCDGIGKGDDVLLDWIIAGGESGPKARPSHPDWFRNLRDQCQAAGVPFFFKQWGEWREFDHGSPDEEVEDDSRAADAIHATAIRPGFVTLDGRFIARRKDLPEDTPCRLMERVGKKGAGATLDGREWREVPA